MERKTKDNDVVMDKNGNILYSPTNKAEATESPGGATATSSPTEAYDHWIKRVGNFEETPISETAPDDAKTVSFKSMPFNVTKEYSVVFTDRTSTVTFLFEATRSDTLVDLIVYWQAGVHRCVGFSGRISELYPYRVEHPTTKVLESTIFIRHLDVTTASGIIKRKYLSADIWLYDHSGSKS